MRELKQYKLTGEGGGVAYIWATSLQGALIVAREHGASVELVDLGKVAIEAK